MKVLIAEDDLTSRLMLTAMLKTWGYDPEVAENGAEAWQRIQQPDAPRLVILDWIMPGMEGLEIIRRTRALNLTEPPYIIILTSRGNKRDIVAGLSAGANDYIAKPYDQEELRARVEVGRRMVAMQSTLAQQMVELKNALDHVRTLEGILPICSYCKKIRDDQQSWHHVESYVAEHTEAHFSHAVCPDCYEEKVKPMMDELDQTTQKEPTTRIDAHRGQGLKEQQS